MNRIATALSIATAFAASCGITHLLRPALAAENITARVIHTGEMEGDKLGDANKVGFRSKMFVSADGATVSIQDGNVPKHMHPNTNEMQFVLEGTGTVWLDDKEVTVKPGDLIVIPKGTPHGGTKPNGRAIKAIAIKTPPQAPDNTKLLD
ncbi:mannose-6-phosphate isomerase-like protein (cupin superfamily) [Bradyrhizobium sp. USDA 4532]|uniref:cupin domain-containing protein n=1 Tax=unclassified Bradyrhizobium TaxID=2631580 RepID=UPI00209FB819|nr:MULTISPECIES: cupin domain-containing protein [unclassified Bradyrhizobium]MCP1831339.1 mannose-6-phosphate isomerase-like protein (cupin superfamily) [Bradyrhizobium sp. USDA 4545]MCP1924448.1 mannose-6-phosphate isomerase-like protein (cupin superfamily) [Bradyrhizobium sp. USDA 4532]